MEAVEWTELCFTLGDWLASGRRVWKGHGDSLLFACALSWDSELLENQFSCLRWPDPKELLSEPAVLS